MENLKTSQGKMKQQYDCKAKARSFKPGDCILVFMPLSGGSLAAKYTGPYVSKSKVDDLNYVICSPARRQKSKEGHVNLIKEYVQSEAETDSVSSIVSRTQSLNVVAQQSVKLCQLAEESVTFDKTDDFDLPMNNSDFLKNLSSHISHLNCFISILM